MWKASAAIAIVVAAALVAASPALAIPITVDSKKDANDTNTGDTTCAAANGKCTLRAAIDTSNALPGRDDIELPAGTYDLTKGVGPPTSNGGGAFYITEGLTITGEGAGATVIRQTRDDRVIETVGGSFPSNPVRFTGVKITGGHITEPGNQFGGGIRTSGFTVLIDSVVTRNAVVPDPGANSGAGGIGVFEGLTFLDGVKVVRNRVAIKNAASTASATGGGIRNIDGVLNLTASTVSRNRLSGPNTAGGGIYADGITDLQESTVSKNTAHEGGGVYVQSPGDVFNLTSSTLSGNRAAQNGGGLWIATGDGAAIENSTFSGNEAKRGSAIYDRLGAIDIVHATIAGNTVRKRHAAIEVDPLFGPPDSEISFDGTAMANRRAECRAASDAFDTGAQNVFADDSCSGDGISSDLIANPKLRKLANNTGPTKTRLPKLSSPVIDFVTTGCPPPALDQRGFTRPLGAACDAGSVELDPGA
jgi:parallel beta-helix repeat protein